MHAAKIAPTIYPQILSKVFPLPFGYSEYPSYFSNLFPACIVDTGTGVWFVSISLYVIPESIGLPLRLYLPLLLDKDVGNMANLTLHIDKDNCCLVWF